MITRGYIISPIRPQISSIICLDIGAHDSTPVCDWKTTVVTGNISVSSWAILVINNSLGCLGRMEIWFLEKVDASEALVAIVVDERSSSKFIYISAILTASAHRSHLKSYSIVVVPRISIPVEFATECKFIVWKTTVSPCLHFTPNLILLFDQL